MNFDTRTVLDIIYLDGKLAKQLETLITEERYLWTKTGKSSPNQFIKTIIPVVKDELRITLLASLANMKMPFISGFIDFDKVDYYQLIPTIAQIT